MTGDPGKLADLLDDPEIRLLIYGLAHSGHAPGDGVSGPARLRAKMVLLIDRVTPAQRDSWLAAGATNLPLTTADVGAVFGEVLVGDIAAYVHGTPAEVAWQLSAVLPALADALSPAGILIPADELASQLTTTSTEDELSAGAFGPHLF